MEGILGHPYLSHEQLAQLEGERNWKESGIEGTAANKVGQRNERVRRARRVTSKVIAL